LTPGSPAWGFPQAGFFVGVSFPAALQQPMFGEGIFMGLLQNITFINAGSSVFLSLHSYGF